jgi:hypothetical protein
MDLNVDTLMQDKPKNDDAASFVDLVAKEGDFWHHRYRSACCHRDRYICTVCVRSYRCVSLMTFNGGWICVERDRWRGDVALAQRVRSRCHLRFVPPLFFCRLSFTYWINCGMLQVDVAFDQYGNGFCAVKGIGGLVCVGGVAIGEHVG